MSSTIAKVCQVCTETSENISLHYGAVTCQACKKFFWRSRNGSHLKYHCDSILKNPYATPCPITYLSRSNCQRCRYDKCLSIGMDITIKSSDQLKNATVLKCSVCGNASNGIHFGVPSCEGCKSFFRRSQVSEKFSTYTCKSNGTFEPCVLNLFNSCRFCRYKKCVEVGMSYESAKIGRRSNLARRQLALDTNQVNQGIKHEFNQSMYDLVEEPQAKKFKPVESSYIVPTINEGYVFRDNYGFNFNFADLRECFPVQMMAWPIPQNFQCY